VREGANVREEEIKSAAFLRESSLLRPFAFSASPRASSQRAFTLVEILIVIGIIVLMVGLAIPAFNAISGSRSVDSAANTISAFVGRARLEAIGLQETRGIFFFTDPVSRDTKVALVRSAGTIPVTLTENNVLLLDLTEGKDLLTLPSGVGVQFVDDCSFNTSTGARNDDGFLGFNQNYFVRGSVGATVIPAGSVPPAIQYGGVILFDAQGRQVVQSYAFKTRSVDGTGVFQPTLMGRRFFTVDNTEIEEKNARTQIIAVPDIVPWQTQGATGSLTPPRAVRSQVGFVLFDKSTFEARGYKVTDPQLNSIPYQSDPDDETAEERWLDENATVYLINRYNGTLVKGE